MLNKLSIKNFALIEDANISFAEGFSVLTGETGSGKSIMLDALTLLLGKRAEVEVIRNGADKCIIEGIFDVSKYQLESFFEEYDLDFDNTCIIRRELTTNGKSRAFVNDSPVVLSTLKLLGELLFDIHSQNASSLLESTWFYYDLLDGLAGIVPERKHFAEQFKNLQFLKNTLHIKQSNKEKAALDLSFKQFQYKELKDANLKAGELEELEAELEILSNAEQIKHHIAISTELLSDQEGSIVEKTALVNQKMLALSVYRSDFKILSERMESVLIELKDIYAEAASMADRIELDPKKLEQTDARLGVLFALVKKYGLRNVEDLLAKQQLLEQEINDVLDGDEMLEQLKQQIQKLSTQLLKQASVISKKRMEGASILEKEILSDLSLMNMKNAQLKINVMPTELHAYGADIIQFNFNANKGGNLQALSKIASGGELSRVMLSLKRILSKQKKLPTILFDEIDTGVSGEVADKMAEIMLKMALEMQVIAITHLPQIASKGTHHFKVFKTDTDNITQSQIQLLDKKARIQEIAQMLSGSKVSAAAIDNAKSLLS